MVGRFMNEALAANAIHHPHIIAIIDVGRLPADTGGAGLPYLMMEYLEGETLGTRLRRQGKLTLAEAVPLLEQAASALGAAHAQGIVHRDLKPDNLFITSATTTSTAPHEHLKILDFGIAKLLREHGPGPSLVETGGALFGTPTYMAPEQCRGTGPAIDPRADVYALGIIAFEMLCGRPPFVGAAAGEVLLMHVRQAPPPLRDLAPDVPEAVAAVIERALAKAPEQRFPSMAELWAALRWAAPWIPPVLPAAPVAPRSPASIVARMSRLSPAQLLLSATAALVACGLLGWWWARPAPAPATVAPAPPVPGPSVTPLPGRPPPRRPAERPAKPAPAQRPGEMEKW
jgi:serine/threonine-protein kinase